MTQRRRTPPKNREPKSEAPPPNSSAKPAAQAIKEIEGMLGCRVVVYTAQRSIGPWDVPPFYSLLENLGHQGKLAIIVQSGGGFPDDAFKIATVIRESASHVTFVVPSFAKSAATLLCLSGDLILMGSVSELGPTNPMMNVDERLIIPTVPQPFTDDPSQQKPSQPRQRQMAAHALRDFLIASGVLRADGTGYDPEVLSVYMAKGVLNPFLLGEFERSAKIAMQYTETLLTSYMFKGQKYGAKLAQGAAKHLCEGYYDHAYPIGRKEAREVLHLNVEDMSPELWLHSSELMQAYDRMMETQNIAVIIESSDEYKITHWPPPP